jgi:hypothetical protein
MSFDPVAKGRALAQKAIEVHIESKSGRLGTRLVTFDLQRHENRVEGYICKECHFYSDHALALDHADVCTVSAESATDQIIIVIGWSTDHFRDSLMRLIEKADLDKVSIVAQVEEFRKSGESEDEVAKWNEGNPVPTSPLSVNGEVKKFSF